MRRPALSPAPAQPALPDLRQPFSRNVPLPRDPRRPWDYDAGFHRVQGQSSPAQKRGAYQASTTDGIAWQPGTRDTLVVPFRDSVMAIADESYFDWPVLPGSPHSLRVAAGMLSATLSWQLHGGASGILAGKRSAGNHGNLIADLPATALRDTNVHSAGGGQAVNRVRALHSTGDSACSNLARARRNP